MSAMQTATALRTAKAAATADGFGWRALANCANERERPWWDDCEEAVRVCREFCRGCEVVEQCAAEALGHLTHVGTMGFTTTSQRAWLRANSFLAHEIADECEAAGVCPMDLGVYYETEGPAWIPEEHHDLSPKAIAALYGVSADVFGIWLDQRGLVPFKDESNSHRKHWRAYEMGERMLRDPAESGVNDGWVPRSEITAMLRSSLDDAAVAYTKRAQERSLSSAWRNLTGSLVLTWLRSGQIEQRPDHDNPGRRLVRWCGSCP